MAENGPPKASPTPVHKINAFPAPPVVSSDDEDDTSSFLSPQDEHSPLGALESLEDEEKSGAPAPTPVAAPNPAAVAAAPTSKDRASPTPVAAISTSKDRASPTLSASTAPTSKDRASPTPVAAISTSKDRASPTLAAAAAAPTSKDRASPTLAAAAAPTTKDRASPTLAAAAASPTTKDRASPTLAAAAGVSTSKDRASPTSSAAVASTSKDRASPAPAVTSSEVDVHDTPAAASSMSKKDDENSTTSRVSTIEDKAPPAVSLVPKEDENKSRAEERASPAVTLTPPKDDSRVVSTRGEGRDSPAVALMCSEDENKSGNIGSAGEESNRALQAKSEAVLPSPGNEKESSPQKPSMPADTILMVPEEGDPPAVTTTNHFNYGESKSSSSLEVKSDNALRRDKDAKAEAKIVARPSTDDDCLPSVSSPYHRRCVSVDLVAKVPANYNSSTPSPNNNDTGGLTRGQIDTAAPFESVKAAVSKFGGIVDWKAHRHHTVERRKFIEQELDKAQEEMPSYKQQCQAANEAKIQVLKKLESTKRLIEELKLNLERAQTEEQQAKQDSELAKLRVEEMEQGIANEASFAAKAQLEVAKARHAAAVSELKTVKDELEQLRTDYDLLIAEKDAAEKKSEEALFTSKQVDKSVESLTIELITLKQSLESAHSAHLEAEEHRIGAVMAKEQDSLNWEVELKQAEEELGKLNQQMKTTKELKSKLAEAMTLLHDLKAELAAYMESKPEEPKPEETLEDPLKEPEKKTRADIETAINAAKKELSDVKLKIEKATKEVNILKVASASLKSQLEKENAELQTIRQREGMAAIAASSLETELSRIKSEINIIHMKEKEEREKLVELPKQLQKAAQEAEQAKANARAASEELKKAKDEAEEAKAGVSTRESKLRAVQKEIEAARASERLALAAITALQESESAQRNNEEDLANGITLSLEEYYELSKRAHEAEEQANARVTAATSQIEKAKELELMSFKKLEEVSRDMSQRKEALEIALQKAEQAAQRKLSVEQELRKWRADHEQRRKKPDTGPSPVNTGKNHDSSGHHQKSPKSGTTSKGGADSTQDGKGGKKKKKSFFPRIFMFLGKRKSHSSKPE